MAKQTFTTGQVLTAAQMTSLQQTAMLGGAASTKTTSYVLVAADAGTSVAMNSTSATTVTVNTGLFAAGDTVTIVNQNTGVCTVTAGTATVRKASGASLALSQYQGGVLDFISASEAIFFPFDVGGGLTSPLTTKGDLWTWDTSNQRLAVGTNGQALLADSTTATGLRWGSAASVPSFTLLGTGITNSGSTVTVSGISGMNQLLIYFQNCISSSAGTEFRLRLNGDSGATNYSYSAQRVNVGSSNAGADVGATSFFRLATTGGASDALAGHAMIFGCNSTNTKVATITSAMSYTGTTGGMQYNGGGYYIGTSTISSVSLITTLGNFNAGSFLVYGSA